MTDPDNPPSTFAAHESESRARRILRPSLEAGVGVHVFSVSAGLVGVCLTVIGILRIGVNVNPGYTTVADELLAVDAVVFMAACLLAYSALRSPGRRHSKQYEVYADRLFILGMGGMCIAGAIVSFVLVLTTSAQNTRMATTRTLARTKCSTSPSQPPSRESFVKPRTTRRHQRGEPRSRSLTRLPN